MAISEVENIETDIFLVHFVNHTLTWYYFLLSMQRQPAVDNCHAPARTDDAIVARTDDAVVARTDDAILTSAVEIGEEAREQDSMAWSRHDMKTLSTILKKTVQMLAILDSMTLVLCHCCGLLECLPVILNIYSSILPTIFQVNFVKG